MHMEEFTREGRMNRSVCVCVWRGGEGGGVNLSALLHSLVVERLVPAERALEMARGDEQRAPAHADLDLVNASAFALRGSLEVRGPRGGERRRRRRRGRRKRHWRAQGGTSHVSFA